MDSSVTSVELRSGFLAAQNLAEAEGDRLLKEQNCYEIENEHLRRSILEKNATMQTIPACLLNMENKVATIKTEKRILSKPNAELIAPAVWKEAKGTHTGDSFIKTIVPMYL